MDPFLQNLLGGSALVSALVLPTALILITMRLGRSVQVQGRIALAQEKIVKALEKPTSMLRTKTFVVDVMPDATPDAFWSLDDELNTFCLAGMSSRRIHSVKDSVLLDAHGYQQIARTVVYSE